MTLSAVLALTLYAVLALTLCSASSVVFQKLSKTTGMPSSFTLDDYDSFGSSVANLGDLDGDGVPDLAVGATGDADGGVGTGAVYVVLMNADGTGKTFQKLSKTAGMPSGFPLNNFDLFGSSVASLGDLDGDGVPDLAVGAMGDDDGGAGTGAVYVVLMNADGTSKTFQKLSKTAGMPSGFTLDDWDFFGFSVANLGDLDGDGVPDLAVGATGDDDGNTDAGAVYVVLMNADGTGKAFQKLSKTVGMPTGFTLDDNDSFGYSVANLGDLDGDGVPDLAVGVRKDDDGGGSDTGAVYVVLMNADGTGKAFQKLSKTAGMPTGFTLDDNDFFGSSVANLGDLDGDGVPDLSLGAFGDDDGGTGTGAVYVVLMNADGTGKAFQKFTLDEADLFGFSVANLGDLDGDGVPALAVGYGEDDGGTVYVFQPDMSQLFSFMPTSLPPALPSPLQSPTPTPLPTSLPTIGLGVLALDEEAVEVVVAVTIAAVGAAVGTAVGGSLGGAVGVSAGGSAIRAGTGGATGGAGASRTPSGNPLMLVLLVQGMFMTSRLSDVSTSYSKIMQGFSVFNL